MKEWMEAAARPKQEKATSGKTKVEIAPFGLTMEPHLSFIVVCLVILSRLSAPDAIG